MNEKWISDERDNVIAAHIDTRVNQVVRQCFSDVIDIYQRRSVLHEARQSAQRLAIKHHRSEHIRTKQRCFEYCRQNLEECSHHLIRFTDPAMKISNSFVSSVQTKDDAAIANFVIGYKLCNPLDNTKIPYSALKGTSWYSPSLILETCWTCPICETDNTIVSSKRTLPGPRDLFCKTCDTTNWEATVGKTTFSVGEAISRLNDLATLCEKIIADNPREKPNPSVLNDFLSSIEFGVSLYKESNKRTVHKVTINLLNPMDKIPKNIVAVEFLAPFNGSRNFGSPGKAVINAINNNKRNRLAKKQPSASLGENSCREASHIRRLLVVSTSPRAKGFKDFDSEVIIPPNTEYQSVFLDSDYSYDAIIRRIKGFLLQPGDVLVIVRGGGNREHASFTPFDNASVGRYIEKLGKMGVIVIAGIGHIDDITHICRSATIFAKTPSFAATKTTDVLGGNTQWAGCALPTSEPGSPVGSTVPR